MTTEGQAAEGDDARDSLERTPEQLREAEQYGRIGLACDLADRALDLLYLAVIAFTLAYPLDGWLQAHLPAGEIETVRLTALFLFTIGGHLLVSLPLSFYAGYLVEHRFGMSRQTVACWLRHYLKRNLLTVVFGLAMFVGLYWLIWLTGPWWWLTAAAAFFLISIVLGQLAPVVILPWFYTIRRIDEQALKHRLTKLAHPAGLSIEGVYQIGLSEETEKANAMLAGLGRTRRVLLGDKVLKDFTEDEIEVIFAHEIGHHVHRHIHKMILAGGLYGILGFWICDRLMLLYASGYQELVMHASFPVWALPCLMLSITVFSMLMEPLQNVVSRHYERQCDRYALETTGLQAAYRSAFQKLAKLNKDNPNPNAWAVFLLHSHPPVAERLAMADEYSEPG